MTELKRIPRSAVSAALKKALRYRLLNEPLHAESICRDILEVDSNNQKALITLLLALTDRFASEFTGGLDQAKQVAARLEEDYERAYYEGIIHERWGYSQWERGMPAEFADGWFAEAMRCYEQAEKLAAADDPDAILRWNTCARFRNELRQEQEPAPPMTHDVQADYGDDVPLGPK